MSSNEKDNFIKVEFIEAIESDELYEQLKPKPDKAKKPKAGKK